jgi:phosphonate transport system ATP-binding protein
MIQFKNVGKVYPNGTEALKNVNLEIKQGEFIAIIGLSGAGKSTLIRLINKMHDITSGELIVNGTKVDDSLKGKELRKFRRGIGMIFQSFNLILRTTVLKNVLAARVAEMGLLKTFLGIYSKEDKVQALSALEQLGILDKAYNRADELSGGQMQRVALARTLAQNPKIILADEPVASLDPITANQVMSDFKKVNQELNITVIANMHHVDMALKYADRVIGINSGEVVYDGPSSKVDNDLLKMVYGRELNDDDILTEEMIMDK